MRRTVKITFAALLVCGLLSLTGCDEEAQEYAKQLGAVLNNYQGEVDRKINAEQDAYKSLSDFYAHAQEEDLYLNLALERNRRVRALADELVGGSKSAPSGTEIRGMLLDYASQDFEQTRAQLGDESEASTRFLANLEELETDSQKVESLGKTLAELSKPKRSLHQLKEFVGFAVAVDSGIQKLACADLQKEIDTTDKQAKDEKDEKAKKVLEEHLAELKAEMETKKCSGS